LIANVQEEIFYGSAEKFYDVDGEWLLSKLNQLTEFQAFSVLRMICEFMNKFLTLLEWLGWIGTGSHWQHSLSLATPCKTYIHIAELCTFELSCIIEGFHCLQRRQRFILYLKLLLHITKMAIKNIS
jgi:hypothetical protein